MFDMRNEAVALLVFLVIALVVSLLAFVCIRRSGLARIVAASVTVVLFQVCVWVGMGLNPFFFIEVIPEWWFSYVIAYVVGIPFRASRRFPPPRHGPHEHTGSERPRVRRVLPTSTVAGERRETDMYRASRVCALLAALAVGMSVMVVANCLYSILAVKCVIPAQSAAAPALLLLVSAFPPLAVLVSISLSIATYRHLRRRRPVGFCTKCRYDLTGNVSGVCPECGTPIPGQTRLSSQESDLS